jgi:hypothetical protein
MPVYDVQRIAHRSSNFLQSCNAFSMGCIAVTITTRAILFGLLPSTTFNDRPRHRKCCDCPAERGKFQRERLAHNASPATTRWVTLLDAMTTPFVYAASMPIASVNAAVVAFPASNTATMHCSALRGVARANSARHVNHDDAHTSATCHAADGTTIDATMQHAATTHAVRRGVVPNDEPTLAIMIDDDAHAVGASAPTSATSSRVKCSATSDAATNQRRGHRRAAMTHVHAASKRIMRSVQASECARLQALCVHRPSHSFLACAWHRFVLARAHVAAHAHETRSRSCHS